jgi:hypothetical protein
MDTTGIVLSVLTIIAIVVGPIVALDVQRRLDKGREERNRKLWVFKTLMSFRATALAPQFVQALNLIEVEFDSKNENEKAVVVAWKVLLDHFGELGQTKNVPANAAEKTATLTTALLIAMGKCLGYDFDEVQIKKGAYYPMGLGNVEQEQHAVRRGILQVLSGKRRIPVGIFEDKFAEINLPAIDEEPEDKALPNPAEPKKLKG